MRFLVHVHGLIQALLLFVVRLLFMDVPGLVSNRLFLCGQGMFWVCVQLETYEISWSHRQRRRARWLLNLLVAKNIYSGCYAPPATRDMTRSGMVTLRRSSSIR